MVLGGGSSQLNLIKRAKSDGHTVVLADYLPDCPGRQFADHYVPVSTFDADGVLRAAIDHRVDGVVTTGTDQPVLTAALTSEALGLPFYIDGKTALAVTNKRVMKEIFTAHGIPHNDYRLIGRDFTDADVRGLRFPAVLKPVDSQGQRGVIRVERLEEVRAQFAESLRYSRENKVLLEAFYKSDEITVNGWAVNGRAVILSVVDRVSIKETNHIGICLCHHYPSVHLGEYGARIKALTEQIVQAFNIQNGPLYFQYLIGEDGLKVNEIAMRIGGAYEDLTIPVISGIDILGLLLRQAEGQPADTSALTAFDAAPARKFVSTQMFFCRPGTVVSVTPETAISKLDGVLAVAYTIGPDYVIGDIHDATARAGYVIIEGDSFAQMLERVNKVFEVLAVLNQAGENLVIKYEEYPQKYVMPLYLNDK